MLTETVNRLRFITSRISAIEISLGSGYIGDAGQYYIGYNSTELPIGVNVLTPPNVITPSGNGTNTTTAQISSFEYKEELAQ
jgi:hypothetical protein